MHRQPLLHLLSAYTPTDPHEGRMLDDMIQFVTTHPDCFERSLLAGHVTGSAWIVSPDRQRVVLLHHRKLDRWLQPGGHCDGNPDVLEVALKEAQEETGLQRLRVVSESVFDVDIHPIPMRGDIPKHLHYDVRFLLEADPGEAFGLSDERKDIQWVPLDKISSLTREESVVRMVWKINSI